MDREERERLLKVEPNMSDTTILMTVEHLINQAMGYRSENTVDFKILEVVLRMLGRQQRILQQKVQLRSSDYALDTKAKTGGRRGKGRPSGGINVVTQSQMALLEADVARLKEVVGMAPRSDTQLLGDIASGVASLPGAMATMQSAARLKATEELIDRVVDMLGKLASSLPPDLAKSVTELKAKLASESAEQAANAVSMAAITAMAKSSGSIGARSLGKLAGDEKSSTRRLISHMPGVTREHFEQCIARMREEMAANMDRLIANAEKSAMEALAMARSVYLSARNKRSA